MKKILFVIVAVVGTYYVYDQHGPVVGVESTSGPANTQQQQAPRQISAAIVTSPFLKPAENRSIAFIITTPVKFATPILEVKLYLARQIGPVVTVMFA